MEISLRPDLEQFVRQKIQAGAYESADGVIAGALELLKSEEQLTESDLQELRREIAIGMDQSRRGESTPLDMDDIRQKVRERIATRPARI